MTSVVVWCLISVVIKSGEGIPFYVETAAKGTLVREVGESYVVDFSKYATEKKYVGTYDEFVVKKDACTPEKK